MKLVKWLIVIVVLGLVFRLVGMPMMQKQTKKHSPEQTATYSQNGLDLAVNYSSPSKKGRVIFGELVPYDVVWRTGANEPTTFITTTDIKVIDKNLPAGTYSLWTKPSEQNWQVMFNSDIPEWGVTILSGGKETTRDPEADIVQVEVPTTKLARPVENFTIGFDEVSGQLGLNLSWDDTRVRIPLNE